MTFFSVFAAVLLAVPSAGLGGLLGSEGVYLCFRLGPELDSPYLCPTPFLHVLRFTPLPSRSQPGSPAGLCRGHEVPVWNSCLIVYSPGSRQLPPLTHGAGLMDLSQCPVPVG